VTFPAAAPRDLTWADVFELRQFLLSTCQDVARLLPPPRWVDGWGLPAQSECANTEQGPSGPWGDDPVRTMYVGGALYLDTIARCLRGLGDALSPATTPYVLEAQARAAMEAGAVLWWLLEPGIGVRRRLTRFWLIRASGARYLDTSVKKVDPKAPPGLYGETPDSVQQAMADLGLVLDEKENRRKNKTTGMEWSTWSWSCENERLPGYTDRARAFEQGLQSYGAYGIYSAATHAEWHAVIAGWRQEPMPTGGTILIARPDLVAAGAAVLGSAGSLIAPAHRALMLLGRGARIHELGYLARRADDLIRRLVLPETWSNWRR
jgi:hypothetical protein